MIHALPSDAAAAPIAVAWLSSGPTGAQNYDEFAADAEIEDLLREQPTSLLSVEMPHCTPEARAQGLAFDAALPAARERLESLKREGLLTRVEDAVLAYRITGPEVDAHAAVVLMATKEISNGPDEPGRVIRNEEVFPEKVQQRAELVRTLGHLTSPILLLQVTGARELDELLREAVASAPLEPTVSDVDQLGQRHELWLVPPGERRDRILELVGTSEHLVADGNHRSLAVQLVPVDRFLAVVTTTRSLRIKPYNRLLRSLPFPPHELLSRLRERRFEVRRAQGPAVPGEPDRIQAYFGPGDVHELRLPPAAGSIVDRLPHTLVERELFGGVLGLHAGDHDIVYVGGDYGLDYLTGEVDRGAAAAALLLPAVSSDDFVDVNRARQAMPRKSTWFTPKARAGLVLAEVEVGERAPSP